MGDPLVTVQLSFDEATELREAVITAMSLIQMDPAQRLPFIEKTNQPKNEKLQKIIHNINQRRKLKNLAHDPPVIDLCSPSPSPSPSPFELQPAASPRDYIPPPASPPPIVQSPPSAELLEEPQAMDVEISNPMAVALPSTFLDNIHRDLSNQISALSAEMATVKHLLQTQRNEHLPPLIQPLQPAPNPLIELQPIQPDPNPLDFLNPLPMDLNIAELDEELNLFDDFNMFMNFIHGINAN